MATGVLRFTKNTVVNVLFACQKVEINREDPDLTASEEYNLWPKPSSALLLCVCHSK